MQKLKGELKTAMRAKDAPRLSVLRSIMTASLNASKTSTPIKTDVQLVGLMRRLRNEAQGSIADAQAAGRSDFADKEMEQVRVMDEYIAGSNVQSVTEAEMMAVGREIVESIKRSGSSAKTLMADAMKQVNAKLQGKDVDRRRLSEIIKELTG